MSIDLFAAYERRAEEKIKGWIREALWQRGIGSRFLDLGHGRGGVPLASLPAHASTHQNAGSDEMSVAGLSGALADAQPVAVQDEGIAVATRAILNFIGAGVVATLDGTRVNITISGGAVLGDLLTDDDGNILSDDDGDVLSQDVA